MEYSIVYNPVKSKLMCFNSVSSDKPYLTLCGKPVDVVNNDLHLGCCLPSETYGRNGVTQIFRSFHRTVSSTQAAGVVGTFNVLLYIILSTKGSFLEDTILFLQVSWFFFHFVYISIFFASILCMYVMKLTSFDGCF